VAGHDMARDDLRVFRLSRIVGEVERTSEPGAFAVPPGALERSAAINLVQPEGESVQARIRVRQGQGHGLRRRAASVEQGSAGWDVLVLVDTDVYRLADELSGYAGDVVVEEPAELRDAVKRSLQAVHEAHA
jgi:proteasome accessory factor B